MASPYDPKNMTFRHLGNTGLRVSVLSLGGWLTAGGTVVGDPVKEIVKAAWDGGIMTFDLAEGYADGNCEIEFGRVFKELGLNRREAVIITKIFWGQAGTPNPNGIGLSAKHVGEGISASLARLGMDYVDVVFAHRPDLATPIEETVRAFTRIINSGKAFYWGTSEWTAHQVEAAYTVCQQHPNLIPPIAEQPKYNLFSRKNVEVDLRPLFKKYHYGTTIFSPLELGYLAGKYNGKTIPQNSRLETAKADPYIKSQTEAFHSEESYAKIAAVEKLTKIADELQCSVGNLALAWCIKNENVSSVITGASRPEQVVENLKALDVVGKLTPEILGRIDEIFPPPEPYRDYGRGRY